MKRLACVATVCAGMMVGPSSAGADVFTFQPTPRADLWDLDHNQAYTWGINWSVPTGQEIRRVTLFIDNMNDWTVEPNDILYVHLLDNPALGGKAFTDSENPSDYFQGQGMLLTTYTDDDGWPNPAEDWTYTFTMGQIRMLETYAMNGIFGFGFDPDCHYNNDGVTLTIETSVPVPEPTVGLLVTVGLGLFGRRLKRIA